VVELGPLLVIVQVLPALDMKVAQYIPLSKHFWL
jgi:hypothetical protein